MQNLQARESERGSDRVQCFRERVLTCFVRARHDSRVFNGLLRKVYLLRCRCYRSSFPAPGLDAFAEHISILQQHTNIIRRYRSP